MQSTSSVRTYRPTKPEEPKKTKTPRQRPSFKLPKFQIRRLSIIVIAVLVLLCVFLSAQYRQAQHKLAAGSPAAAQKHTQSVVDRVGKLIILPKKQTPTVATVLDSSKLKSQSFFANAQNGDQVLIYRQTNQAILYRPSTNQLVNVSNLSPATSAGATTAK